MTACQARPDRYGTIRCTERCAAYPGAGACGSCAMNGQRTESVTAVALLPCPFCGGAMEEVTDEDGHYFVHPGRKGIDRADCWLCDAWISDEPSGEGSIGEWNTRAPPLSLSSTDGKTP